MKKNSYWFIDELFPTKTWQMDFVRKDLIGHIEKHKENDEDFLVVLCLNAVPDEYMKVFSLIPTSKLGYFHYEVLEKISLLEYLEKKPEFLMPELFIEREISKEEILCYLTVFCE